MRTGILAFVILWTAQSASAQTVAPALETQKRGPPGSPGANVTDIQTAGPGTFGDVVGEMKRRANDPARVNETIKRADWDVLPPPLLLEYGWRGINEGRADGRYAFILANTRMRWDAAQCTDATAQDAPTVVRLSLPPFSAVVTETETKAPSDNTAILAKIVSDHSIFSGRYSAWWACSQGMNAIDAAVEHRTLKESEWRKSPAELADARTKLEAAYRQAVADAQKKAAARPTGAP